MSHDWGTSVPAELPIETMIEIRDGLRTGTIKIDLPASVEKHELAEEWRSELPKRGFAVKPYRKPAFR